MNRFRLSPPRPRFWHRWTAGRSLDIGFGVAALAFRLGWICLWLGSNSLLSAASGQATFQTLLTNGPAANRLNVVFLSEGYTTNQLAKFLVDATNALVVLLNKAPFNEYQSYFNAFAISVPSAQSGSDHPSSGLYRDTYFNSSYDAASDLYITIPPNDRDPTTSHGQGKVDALVQRFMPRCKLAVLLVNDPVPGGSDGFDKTAVCSVGHLAFLPHEVGHVLAGLGDEYSTPNPGFPDTEEPNTTRETRRDFVKWNVWIATNTPLPTPSQYTDVIGLFEGAHYHDKGWFRPKLNCAMNSPESDFCEVCGEALLLALYQRVRPVEAALPASANLIAYAPELVTFALELAQPLTHNLAVRWYTNGVLAPATTRLTLPSASLKLGANTVQAVVRDPTPLVRTDPSNRLSHTVTWTLNVKAPLKPTITITSPASNTRTCTSAILMAGTAKDIKYGLDRVECQVGDGPFLPATGTTNWTVSVALAPGTNQVRVRSINSLGTGSELATRAVFRVVTEPLALTIAGAGTVTPSLAGQPLELGKIYKLTAKPATGSLFSNWVGGVTGTNCALSFVMVSNLTLQANFVTNPFSRLQGTYVGLFADPNRSQDSSGAFTLTLTERGTYSGSLQLNSNRYPFSGRCDVAGTSVQTVSRSKLSPLTLHLALHLAPGADRLDGTITDGRWHAALAAVRSAFSSLQPASLFQGQYTLAFLGDAGENASPSGHGVAALNVNTSGKVSLSGSLADGTPVTQTTSLSASGLWPLYLALYGGKGSLWGWFTNQDLSTFRAGLSWVRPALPGARLHTAGFTNITEALSARYSVTNRILTFTNALVVFAGGNLPAPFTNQLLLGADNKLTNLSGNRLNLSLVPATGLFNGTVTPPTSNLSIQFQGTILQNFNTGLGYFLGTNQSGRVTLWPAD